MSRHSCNRHLRRCPGVLVVLLLTLLAVAPAVLASGRVVLGELFSTDG